jgi:hypothetical protein
MENFFNDEWDTLVFKNGENHRISGALARNARERNLFSLHDIAPNELAEPVVLYFRDTPGSYSVDLDFRFPLDLVEVRMDGTVRNAVALPPGSGKGSAIRKFKGFRLLLICPEGYIGEYAISTGGTIIDITTYDDYVCDYVQERWKSEIREMSVAELTGRHELYLAEGSSGWPCYLYNFLVRKELDDRMGNPRKEVFTHFFEEERMEINFETLIINVSSINRVCGSLKDFTYEYQITNGCTNGKLLCLKDMNLCSAYLDDVVERCLQPRGLKEYEDYVIVQEQMTTYPGHPFVPEDFWYVNGEHPHLRNLSWLGSVINDEGNLVWYIEPAEPACCGKQDDATQSVSVVAGSE